MATKKAAKRKKSKAVQVVEVRRKRGRLSEQMTFRVTPTLRTWLDRQRSKHNTRGLGDTARAVLESVRKSEGAASD